MTNMVCTKCGEALDASAKFCSSCGTPVVGSDETKSPKTGKRNPKRDVLIIVGVIVVVVVGYLYMYESPVPPQPRPQAQASGEAPIGHDPMESGVMGELPTDYASLVAMGNEYMDATNYPMAAELYRRALDIDGSSPDVRSDFGSCLHAMGLPHRALDEFRTIINEHPEHTIVNFNMGIVFFNEGVHDSARVYWERYLAMDPEGRAAESARSFMQRLEN